MSRQMENAYIEVELEKWNDIFNIGRNFFSRFVFRGQSNSDWGLETALERHVRRYYPYNSDSALCYTEEFSMLKEFKWKYPLYSSSIPDEHDIVEWLTIMQHYGAPTRLLDFTHSLFIALFFAIASSTAASSVVWAVNKHTINKKTIERYLETHEVSHVSGSNLDSFILEQANSELIKNDFNHKEASRLHLIKPKRSNDRISRQQGLFLMPTNLQIPFKNHLMPYLSSDVPTVIPMKDFLEYAEQPVFRQEDIALLKIKVPSRLNYDIVAALREMNLTAEHLFPGLEGLAMSLAYLRHQGMGN